MTPQPGRWGPPPKSETPILDKVRWVVILLVAAGVIAFLVVSKRGQVTSTPLPLAGYQRDMAVLEKEYGQFHGKLLREPELEHQFQSANQFIDQQDYPAAITILEKVSQVAAVPVVFLNLGELYAAVGDRARSIGAFREALARDAEYRPVRDSIERLRLFTADEALPVRQELEPNNSETVANLIGLDRRIDGEIVAGDTDTFRFVTPPAPRDILQIEIENADRSLELGIRVHDDDLRNDSGRVIGAPGESLRRYISQPPNRPLYLSVWGARDTAGKYVVTVKNMKAFDALEPNDDIFSARRLDLGKPYEANIMDTDDSDFYSFQAPRTGTVKIQIKSVSSTLIPALTTFGTDRRNSGFGPDLRKAGTDLEHVMEVQDFRTYYVQVWSQGRTSGKYSITIE